MMMTSGMMLMILIMAAGRVRKHTFTQLLVKTCCIGQNSRDPDCPYVPLFPKCWSARVFSLCNFFSHHKHNCPSRECVAHHFGVQIYGHITNVYFVCMFSVTVPKNFGQNCSSKQKVAHAISKLSGRNCNWNTVSEQFLRLWFNLVF